MRSVNTVIDQVTVYRDGALIRRVGTIAGSSAKESSGDIAIRGLPLCMDDYSVRAGLSNDTGKEYEVRDLRITLEVPEGDSELREPENIELKDARQSAQRLRRELSELKKSIERIRSVSWPDRMIPEDLIKMVESPLDERSTFAEYITERYSALVSRRKKLMDGLKKVEEDLEILENREYNASTAKQNRVNELRKSVILGFGVDNQPEVGADFYVEYLVPGAKWAAAYRLQFNGVFSHSTLDSRALVSQYSGEDWNGVDISLSTALPHRWHDLPELGSKRIGRTISRKPKPGWKAPPVGADTLYSDFDGFKNEHADTILPEETLGSDDIVGASSGYKEELSAELSDEMELPSEFMNKSSVSEDSEESPMPIAELPRSSRKMKKSAAPSPAIRERLEAPGNLDEEASMSDAMLNYDALRQGDFLSSDRSVLRVISKKERYLEILTDLPGIGDAEIMDSIITAESRIREMGSSDPPSGCAFPAPVDGYDFSFNADNPVSITSDGRYQSIPLNSRSLSSSMRYVVVPREDCSVFASAELINSGEIPLMPGPVDIRVESDFLCTGNFDFVPGGGIARLGLGVEQGIKVARNTKFHEQTSGLAGGNLVLKHEIEIEVANNLSRKIDMEVRERIPTQRTDQTKNDEKVKIEIVSIRPKWELDNLDPYYVDGAHKWRVVIDPGEQMELTVHYDINIPSNTEVAGGNNREAE